MLSLLVPRLPLVNTAVLPNSFLAMQTSVGWAAVITAFNGGQCPPYIFYCSVLGPRWFFNACSSSCIRLHSRARRMVMRMVSLRKGLVMKS